MKQISSEITTTPTAAREKIGMLLGELGSGTPENLQNAAVLSALSPIKATRGVLSLASQHNVALKVEYDLRFPTGPNGENLPSVSVASRCKIKGGTDEERAEALNAVAKYMTPAPQREIEGWLAELSVIVARRKHETVDEALRLEAYASRLREYPADVTRHALLKHQWRFWPTWAELAEVCDQHAGPRRMILDALTRPAPTAESEKKKFEDELARERAAAYGRQVEDDLRKKQRAQEAKEKRPHWSKRVAADDPRWDQLRESRAKNALMSAEKTGEI